MYLKERNSMVIEVIGLLEGDGHCVAERKKQHGYRSDWICWKEMGTVYLKERNSMVIEVIGLLEGDGHCVPERKKQHGYRSDWSVGRRWALCT